MKKYQNLYIQSSTTLSVILILCLLASCNRSVFDEVNPTTEIIQTEGYDFFIRGTVDGVPFSVEHRSGEEYNSPINDDETTSGHPFFGTLFISDKEETPTTDLSIAFGITEIGDNMMSEVVKVGNLSWYNFAVPSNSQGEAFVNDFYRDEKGYTSYIDPTSAQYNDFNITNIELLEHDDNLAQKYDGNIYKVEGNFQSILYYTGIPKDTIELVVEEFSAMFYDNSL